MKSGRVFIKLESGQNRVESLFNLATVGRFCDDLGTLWRAVPELTGR